MKLKLGNNNISESISSQHTLGTIAAYITVYLRPELKCSRFVMDTSLHENHALIKKFTLPQFIH